MPWVNGSSFGHGDKVGLLVNMDTRTVNVYKNRVFLGKAFGKLPDRVYPLVCLARPDVSAEISFPRFEEELVRERRQSRLWLAHLAAAPHPPPQPVSIKRMAHDPVTHRKALAKKLRGKMRELKAEIRLRGTEQGPPHSASVPGHSLWNLNTVEYWIDLHKCRSADLSFSFSETRTARPLHPGTEARFRARAHMHAHKPTIGWLSFSSGRGSHRSRGS